MMQSSDFKKKTQKTKTPKQNKKTPEHLIEVPLDLLPSPCPKIKGKLLL